MSVFHNNRNIGRVVSTAPKSFTGCNPRVGFEYLKHVPVLTQSEYSIIMAAQEDAQAEVQADKIIARRARMIREAKERSLHRLLKERIQP